MKKALVIFLSVIFILFLAILLVPIVFKTQIRDAVNTSISESVNAEVVWDPSNFSLSLLRNFPNATAGMSQLGIVNRSPFEGEVLLTVEDIEVEIDLFSLFGDDIKIKGVTLIEPVVSLKINEKGEANYDIAVEGTEVTSDSDTTTSTASVSIDHWEIREGTLRYEDATLPMLVELRHIQHTGSGNLEADVFDLSSYTLSDSVFISYDGVEYISNKRLEADVTMTISDNYSTYEFKENFAKINDLNIGVNGLVSMPGDAIELDLTFAALDNSFKSLLSLVPGIYTENFEDITSEGTLDLSAHIKGILDSTRYPAFDLKVATKNAMFQYPDLPQSVKNISLDLEVSNADGIVENTRVALNQLHLEFGSNPLDARIIVDNLRDYNMDADIKANLNFEEITSIFPMEGMTLKGLAQMDVTAKGVYDSVTNRMPTINGDISISDGFIRSSELPYALDNLTLDATIRNTSGNLADFVASIANFSMLMDDAPFSVKGEVRDLVNYTWNLDVTGKLDLGKVAGIMNVENMTLTGLLNADIHTRGNLEALEAERYTELPTSGTLTIMDFAYSDNELPYNVTISEAAASFTPQYVALRQLNGTIGESDFAASGRVANYLGYVFGENQVIQGELDVKSKYINLNQFMEEEDDSSIEVTSDSANTVIPVPAQVDFDLTASIAQVDLLDLTLTNAVGIIKVKDETADLRNLKFNMLGGEFGVNGLYSTQNMNAPAYTFGLDIKQVSIAQSFKQFEMVKRFAPIAEKLTGTFSADFNLEGLLNEDMTARLTTVDAKGMLEVMQATLQNSEILTKISGLTSLNTPSELSFTDVIMAFTIEDGKLQLDPFDFNLGGYPTTVEGATFIDGSIAYEVTMQVPADKLGSSLSGFLSQAGVAKGEEGKVIPITIGLGGTYKDPQPQLMMEEQKAQVKEALKEEAKSQAKGLLNNLLGNEKADSVQADSVASDSVKADSSKTDLQKEATKVINDLFKKKKKDNGDQ